MTDYIERDNSNSSVIGVTIGVLFAVFMLIVFLISSGVWRPATTVISNPPPVVTTAPAIEIPKQVDVNINQRQTP